jgi:hypothetical protein
MPFESSLVKHLGRPNFDVKSEEFNPVFTQDIGKFHMLN